MILGRLRVRAKKSIKSFVGSLSRSHGPLTTCMCMYVHVCVVLGDGMQYKENDSLHYEILHQIKKNTKHAD